MTPWSDLIGIGDTLTVTLFEAGPGLFPQPTNTTGVNFTLLVNSQGQIFFPYAGLIPVAGHTPMEVASRSNMPSAEKQSNRRCS